MAHAFILAAGFGTRLRPLTADLPKPLVPVCGVPLLSWSLALCARHGLTDVIVNGHWKAEALEPWAGSHEGCQVSLSIEQPDILGTGGGLKVVAGQLAERFAVLNGDVLHSVDLTALLGAVRGGGGAMALRPDPVEAPRYGVVAQDASGTVVQLTSLATATPEGPVDETTHFTGIHALDRAALDRVPEGFACIVREGYVHWVPERRVGGIRYEGPWLDCGDPEAYLDTNLAVLRGSVRGAVDPHRRAAFAVCGDTAFGSAPEGVRIEGSVWIGPGARIEAGARLRDCVVGSGAVVRAGTELDRCVVWDGVEVNESGARSIWMNEGVHAVP